MTIDSRMVQDQLQRVFERWGLDVVVSQDNIGIVITSHDGRVYANVAGKNNPLVCKNAPKYTCHTPQACGAHGCLCA